MITANFEKLLSLVLQASNNSSIGYIPYTRPNGNTYYLSNRFNYFPYTFTVSVLLTNSVNSSGIKVGSGLTAPSKNDYNLEAQITSGLTAGGVTSSDGLDENGNLYREYLFTLTNTTSSDITVSEIGFFITVAASSSQGGSASSAIGMMIDRTLLSSPVTVPAGDSAAIKYRLKCVMS